MPLNALSSHMICVQLAWIKAHIGHPGNEEADLNAKEGASNPVILTHMPPSWGYKSEQIENIFRQRWSEQ